MSLQSSEMYIPLIPKNPALNDFNCRDGEIDFIINLRSAGSVVSDLRARPGETAPNYGMAQQIDEVTITRARTRPEVAYHINNLSLIINHLSLETTLRIPLLPGEKEKAALLLNGEISRVDPETADRLTQAMVQKAAECLLDFSTDLRRRGLFILPFRVYTMLQTPDGTLSYPSPQAVALPTDFPPHPEITAASTTDDALTIAIRFPVSPHRLCIVPPEGLPEGFSVRTFISYPLYIPDPKEMRGSIGSVRSASGGQATGIRFAFLTTSAIKASVAAPEKYYELVGNERTGYRLSSKAAAPPDYSCYAEVYGYVPPFPRSGMMLLGGGVAADTDPLDWIADWRACSDGRAPALPASDSDSDGRAPALPASDSASDGRAPALPASDSDSAQEETTQEGYLPISLPYKFCHPSDGSDSSDLSDWPTGIDADFVSALADEIGASRILLTRPMTLASDSVSRRHASPKAIRTIRVLGLVPTEPALALLYGSDDGVRWTPLRRFDPRVRTSVLTPPRLFWRLLLIGTVPGSEARPGYGAAVILTASP